MKRILLYVDNNPFPPKDGVSIAINSLYNNYLRELSAVDLYCVKEDLILCLNNDKRNFCVDYSSYDVIITSPVIPSHRFLKNLETLNRNNDKKVKLLTLLNDCYTYVLIKQIILCLKFRRNLASIPKIIFKVFVYYMKERRISKNYDSVLLQTQKDANIFNRLFFTKKSVVVPNIPCFVNTSGVERRHNLLSVGFVATFIGSYCMIADWFFENVWPEVTKIVPDARLYLVGRNNAQYVDKFDNELKKSIIVEDYYEDLTEFYSKMHITVSPIFKGYGLINKTVEAMANGCIVIGDEAAFNGIDFAQDGFNCIMVNEREAFIKAIVDNLGKEDMDIRTNAKEAIMRSLNKDKYYEGVMDSIYK